MVVGLTALMVVGMEVVGSRLRVVGCHPILRKLLCKVVCSHC